MELFPLKITDDGRLDLIVSSAILGSIVYFILRNQDLIPSVFHARAMVSMQRDLTPDYAIARITRFIISRSIDRPVSETMRQSIRNTVNSYRPQIESVILERKNGAITPKIYKMKLRTIAKQIAQDMDIGLKNTGRRIGRNQTPGVPRKIGRRFPKKNSFRAISNAEWISPNV